MKLTIEHNETVKTLFEVNQDQLNDAIDSIDGQNSSYIILENPNGNYLQCAGSKSHLTVEYREIKTPTFKHFVIAPEKVIKSPLKVTWNIIECKVGPIKIHNNEVMSKSQVKQIFCNYLSTGYLDENLNLRNITRQFKK